MAKYLSKKGYSCHYEVGLNKWGKLRSDIFAFNYKRNVIIIEVKSSWEDFRNDKKWKEYLPFCNKFMFAVAQDFDFRHEFIDEAKSVGAGILQVNLNLDHNRLKKYHSNSVSSILSSKSKKMEGKIKRDIIVKLAFRNGLIRTNKNNWLNQVKGLL